jgi:predicted amidohydrolase YtcJ
MIAAYTKNGAHLMHQEQLTGQLQVGKRADLVVLSDNLFTLAPHEISEVSVVATYFEGRQVFPYES